MQSVHLSGAAALLRAHSSVSVLAVATGLVVARIAR